MNAETCKDGNHWIGRISGNDIHLKDFFKNDNRGMTFSIFNYCPECGCEVKNNMQELIKEYAINNEK